MELYKQQIILKCFMFLFAQFYIFQELAYRFIGSGNGQDIVYTNDLL